MNKKYAVIDYGTNSARLMIASFDGEKIITNYKKVNTIRIGEGMQQKIITDGAMQRSEKATLEFLEIAEQEKVSESYIFATSAVRDAKNSADFSDYIFKTTGMRMDIISGKNEARIGYIGATYGRTDDAIGMLDIGGGSTEVVFGDGHDIEFAHSYNIGIVRLLQMFPNATPANLDEYKKCSDYIQSVFDKIPKNLYNKTWLGIGGTTSSLAAMHQKLEKYDTEKVHGYFMSNQDVYDILCETREMTINQRKDIPTLDPKRADVIVFGIMLTHQFLTTVKAKGITACESDNQEGYLLSKLNLT